ncbi:regulatory protein RecX [Cohnella thailandensis]|uniref:Regulatory protein RecX n=1 Tax=Cohnella thailandensis TaxID=557557 RepID=A0A841SYL2_9BACL|nr:regulatory protein RecX [Cohnella thailandensis]MBB6635315.1 regulatory protein RecX [Cohnella thailandensis]MBP1974694.1 regulatory protein [Cohnella thailandensis]
MDEHAGRKGNLNNGEKSSAVHAVVVGIEADARRSSMYRIAVVPQNGGESELIQVHEDTMVSWRLLKGRRLTLEEWEGLKRTEQLEQAYRSALLLLDRKARTRKELEQALKRKGFEAEAIAGCIDRLAKHRLIDDANYAARFAEQKVANQRKGSRLVRQQLRSRGVAKQDVDTAISSLESGVERNAAMEFALKKWPSVKGERRREREHKLLGMLLRRGYPTSIAVEAVRHAARHFEEEDNARGRASSWDEEDGGELDSAFEDSYEDL